MKYLTALRVGLALIGTTFQVLGSVTAAYVATATILGFVRRRRGRRGVALLSALLLLDGLYLAGAMYATGGTQSPIRFLIYLHLVAVSLLGSYRTGLKIALWHSLLQFVLLYAQAAQPLPSVEVVAGREVEFDRLPVLNIMAFWLFALATSVFSAMNKRELRHGRSVTSSSRALRSTSAWRSAPRPVDDRTRHPRRSLGLRACLVVRASDHKVIVLASSGTSRH